MQSNDDHQEHQHSRVEWLITLGGSALALLALGLISNQAPSLLIALTH